ncbi:zinc-binding dehydrogenase [Jiulongibacter sediminis]|jgi:NADPH:quinone reductase-like Zn-dependent oxidoreductase/acyl dehydratase|uniref:zinc-binding dehydrogenase n=1 Tax=Jiulongibacter sediminis TaxID=1605367 RepID=UPI0026EBAAD0|nr:zinc-binding dehydrogenase [Jiulongibacter sediminis]
MKGLVCESFGKPENLYLKEVTLPQIAASEVLISVKACGLNFPDTLIIQNLYQFTPELPFSPGGEVSGVIEAVGEQVKNFKVGDAVFTLCKWGGCAEKLIVDEAMVSPIIPGMDFINAAATSYNYGTSFHALKDRGFLKKRETLLVLGAAGGVGLAAVELGKIMGARVIAAASSDEKLEACRAKGADELINYEKEGLKTKVKELTDGKGVDVVFDPVGGKYTNLSIRALGWGGRYLVVGFANGEIPQIPLNIPLLKGASITGVFWSRFSKEEPEKSKANLKELGRLYTEGKIKAHISKVYPLDDGAQALQDLMDRKVIGKAVVIPVTKEEAEIVPVSAIEKSSKQPLLFSSKEAVKAFIGKEIGVSNWVEVTQQMIDLFAEATADHQWIHIDPEKAKSSPFKGTIAHGYLTLSLIPKLMGQVYQAPFSSMGINYGTEKVRFVNPVPSGSQIRAKALLKHVSEVRNGGLKMIVEATIEIKGQEKPACFAEVITVLY